MWTVHSSLCMPLCTCTCFCNLSCSERPVLFLYTIVDKTWFHSPKCSLNGPSPITPFTYQKCVLPNSTFLPFPCTKGCWSYSASLFSHLCICLSLLFCKTLSSQKARCVLYLSACPTVYALDWMETGLLKQNIVKHKETGQQIKGKRALSANFGVSSLLVGAHVQNWFCYSRLNVSVHHWGTWHSKELNTA